MDSYSERKHTYHRTRLVKVWGNQTKYKKLMNFVKFLARWHIHFSSPNSIIQEHVYYIPTQFTDSFSRYTITPIRHQFEKSHQMLLSSLRLRKRNEDSDSRGSGGGTNPLQDAIILFALSGILSLQIITCRARKFMLWKYMSCKIILTILLLAFLLALLSLSLLLWRHFVKIIKLFAGSIRTSWVKTELRERYPVSNEFLTNAHAHFN